MLFTAGFLRKFLRTLCANRIAHISRGERRIAECTIYTPLHDSFVIHPKHVQFTHEASVYSLCPRFHGSWYS